MPNGLVRSWTVLEPSRRSDVSAYGTDLSVVRRVGVMFEPWRHNDIRSSGGVPDAFVEMALKPVTMREVFV